MEILLGDKEGIDFDTPVKMSNEQRRKFISFLESMFRVVKVYNTDQFRRERLGDKFFMKEWDLEEYEILFEIEDTENVARMLGRSWMSVDIKRGQFLPEFLAWADEKGKDILKGDTKKLIKEFIKEKQNLINTRKQKRKRLRELEKERESMSKKEGSHNLLKRLRRIDDSFLSDFRKKKEEVSSEIKKLEKELYN